MPAEDLQRALSMLMDNELSAEDFAELQGHLRNSPEARVEYRELVRLHGALAETSDGKLIRPMPGSVVPMDKIIARQKRRSLKIAGLAAAAVLMVGVVVLMNTILPEPPLARFSLSPKTEFVLTHDTPEGEDAPVGNEIEVGSRLFVKRGTVELNFASGVRGIVHGPADFTLRDRDLVDLEHGTVWFDVPENAVGFKVDTPEFLVTDLGTAFGIFSGRDQPDEVHVFEGQVEVQRHDGLEESVLVEAGGARVGAFAGGWGEIAFAPGQFFTRLPSTDPTPPYLYWAFDRFDGDTMPVDGTHPAASAISSTKGFANAGPEVVEGRIGGGLSFGKTMDHIVTDWRGIGGADPRAVAFWLKIEPHDDAANYNSTLVTWGSPGSEVLNDSWALRASNSLGVPLPQGHPPGQARPTVLQLWFGANWINGSTDLADGQWHHIAISYAGRTDPQGRPGADLYVDGRVETARHHGGPTALRTDLNGAGSNPLLIGRSKTRPEASCDASLDELYIFDGAIDRHLVRSLAQAAWGWRP